MNLKQELYKNRVLFIKKWFQATIDTYPAQTAKILSKDSNRFDNPIGSVTYKTIENVFNLIIKDFNDKTLEKELDPVIRIRAVQSFSASQAVSFVFALKDIGENILGTNKIGTNKIDINKIDINKIDINKIETNKIETNKIDINMVREFDKLVDKIALAAFNKFMKCREEIFLLKATESKRRVHRAFERAGLVAELTQEDLVGSNKS